MAWVERHEARGTSEWGRNSKFETAEEKKEGSEALPFLSPSSVPFFFLCVSLLRPTNSRFSVHRCIQVQSLFWLDRSRKAPPLTHSRTTLALKRFEQHDEDPSEDAQE